MSQDFSAENLVAYDILSGAGQISRYEGDVDLATSVIARRGRPAITSLYASSLLIAEAMPKDIQIGNLGGDYGPDTEIGSLPLLSTIGLSDKAIWAVDRTVETFGQDPAYDGREFARMQQLLWHDTFLSKGYLTDRGFEKDFAERGIAAMVSSTRHLISVSETPFKGERKTAAEIAELMYDNRSADQSVVNWLDLSTVGAGRVAAEQHADALLNVAELASAKFIAAPQPKKVRKAFQRVMRLAPARA